MRLTRMSTQERNRRLILIEMDAKMLAIDIAMLAVELRLRRLDAARPKLRRGAHDAG